MSVRQNLYLELDSLIDTTLGMLYTKWPDKYQALDLESYINRITYHVWKVFGIEEDKWNNAWRNRDVDFLLGLLDSGKSFSTELFTHLGVITASSAIQGNISPVHQPLHIYLNVWPYKFTDDELDDLKFLVMEKLPAGVNVTTIKLMPEALTPSYVKTNFDRLILGDLVNWMTHHSKALTENKMPTVFIDYPKVLHEDAPEILEKIHKSSGDPFSETRLRAAEFVTLGALNASLFSIDLKR